MAQKRLHRISNDRLYIGVRHYLVTICTHNRNPGFDRVELVVVCRDQILRAAASARFAIVAYVFMPDHLHLIAEGTRADSDMRRFVKIAKQMSSFYLRGCGYSPLWQEGYHDRIVRRTEDLSRYIQYIRDNPLKAGLPAERSREPFLWIKGLKKSEFPQT
jgi:REP element-mobilizing transposase RayT